MLESHLLLDLPYDPLRMMLGYEDVARATNDRYTHLDHLTQSSSLLDVAADYANSFDISRNKTLLHFRDYLIAKSLIYLLRPAIYTSDNAQNLTAHTNKVIQRHPTSQFYSKSLSDSTDRRFGGLLGTLGYYYKYADSSGYPIDYINSLLRYIWSINGLNYDDPPSARIARFYRLVGREDGFDDLVSRTIDRLFSIKDPSDDDYPILLYARRNYLSVEDGRQFNRKLLLGKYNQALMVCLAALLDERVFKRLDGYATNLLSVNKPAGFNLLLHALIVEGLIKAASAISAIPEEYLELSIADFIIDDKMLEYKANISAPLATALDSLDFMTQNRLYQSAASEYEALRKLIYAWTPPAVTRRAGTRLYTLFDTVDIDSNDYTNSQPDYYDQIVTLSPVGSKALFLSSNGSFTGQAAYTAANLSDDVQPVVVFITRDRQQPNARVREVRTDLVSRSYKAETRIIVDNFDQRPLVAAALTGVTVDNGSYLSAEDFMSLRQVVMAEEGDGAISNIEVVEPFFEPDNITDAVDTEARRQLNSYSTYNRLSNSTPRGSSASRMESNGLTGNDLTVSQIKDIYNYKKANYLDEYAGRMSGLMKQHKDVHISSEVKKLQSWASSIRDIVG